jgi:hypothetical protein
LTIPTSNPPDDAEQAKVELAAKPPVALLSGKLPVLVNESAVDRWVWGVLAMGLILAYALALHVYWSPAHPGVDQNGYLVGGKMFAETWSTGFKPPDPFSFVGRMWVEADNGKYFPKYPLGLSVIYAVALKIGGVSLAFMVNPVAMTLGIVATFLLVRLAAGSFAGLLAAIIMATSPVTLGLTNNPNSHATAICCVAWGMYLLLRWWQSNGLARAIGAGLLLGTAVTIRYTEGLVVLPLVLAALLNLRWRNKRSRIETASLGAAWALPVVILAAYNWFSFHHLTGYDPTNESTGFSWDYFQDNWETMLRQLYTTGLFFILPFSILGLVLMWRWNWRMSLVLTVWILPNVAIYTAYYWAPDGTWIGYLRFFLTIFPGLALTAVWSFRRFIDLAAKDGSKIAPRIAIAVIVAIGCGVNLNTALVEIENDAAGNLSLDLAGKAILHTCPAGSVIFGQDRFLNYVQLIGNYQLYDTQQFNRATIQRFAHVDPDQPNGLQPQRAKEMYDRLKDASDAELMKEQNNLMTSAFATGKRVFFLVSTNSLNQATRFLPRRLFYQKFVGAWEEPGDSRPVRKRPWVGFAAQRAAADQNRSTIWEIMEVTAVPPPQPRIRQGPRRAAATQPAN